MIKQALVQVKQWATQHLSADLTQRLVDNRLAPMLIAVILATTFSFGRIDVLGWGEYLFTVARVLLELSPIFVCKYLSINSRGMRGVMAWLVGFVAFPGAAFLLLNNQMLQAHWLISDEKALYILWLLEVAALAKYWLGSKLNHLRFKPSLDNVFLVILIGVSLFMAAVFNSIDDPLNNQPIAMVIDIKRNILHFATFIAYWLQFMCVYGALYLAYYINHHWLINQVLKRHGVYHYIWVSALFLLVAGPVVSQVLMWLPINVESYTLTGSTNYYPFSVLNLYIGFLVILFSLPLILTFKLQVDNTKLAQLEQEKLKTELKWLQQQINPHFLFNTLNNLYALCLAKSEKAPELILQLASLLRFVVYKGGNERVSLVDEMDYLNDYIQLQQLRVENKCQLRVNLPSKVPSLPISPLLLVMFIENAFKHGVEVSDQQSQLDLMIEVSGNTLHFCCKNSMPEQASSSDGGIGLVNVQRRLALSYPDKHQLTITETDGFYRVELTLELL